METPRLFRYIIVGVLSGVAYGAAGLLLAGEVTPSDIIGTLGLASAIGALMGLELFHSRAWNRFGKRGWIARWAIAGASAFAGATSVLYLIGSVPERAIWIVAAVGAVLGAGLGVETFDTFFRTDDAPQGDGSGLPIAHDHTANLPAAGAPHLPGI